MTKAMADKIGMRVNVNFLEGKVIEQQAVRQYVTNFTRQNNYFKIACPSMPEENRRDWELELTRIINKTLKRCLPYYNLFNARFASVVRHGVGPQIWYDKESWLPEFVSIEDLRIPTDTETNMHNLVWFAVRKRYTPGELAKRVFGREADPGWDKPTIKKILASYKNINNEEPGYDWYTNPEKMLDLYKQNMGYWTSDAIPAIVVWQFYHLNEKDETTGTTEWLMKVVPCDNGIHGLDQNTFLYNSEEPVADCLEQLLHIQFGDLNGKPPFSYHAVRALGFLIMEPVYWLNLTRCRFLQHVWENFNILLRGIDPTDRARSQKVELFDRGWLPNDVQIVPQEQRHQIDSNLVEMAMAQMKQLMTDSSAGYTQDIDQGTKKERTAYEVNTLVQNVNSMLSGLLNAAYQLEVFSYREICRRLTIKKSMNKDAELLWQACKRAGIPEQYLDANLWDITPDVPLGSGNQSLEMAQAQMLMQNRGAYPGPAQQQILHLFTAAATNSAKLAQELVPLEQKMVVSDAKRDAEFAFGTMMQGVPVNMKEGLNPIDQIDTLLGLMSGVIARLEQLGGTALPMEVAGLQTVMQYVGGLIQSLASDPEQKQRVKQYGDALGQLGNQVKAFGQQLQESMKGQQKESISINYKDAPPDIRRQMEQSAGFKPSQDPESQVDAKTAKAQHQMALKQAGFEAEQKRKDQQTQADVERMGLKTGVELAHKTSQHQVDLAAQQVASEQAAEQAKEAEKNKPDESGGS